MVHATVVTVLKNQRTRRHHNKDERLHVHHTAVKSLAESDFKKNRPRH